MFKNTLFAAFLTISSGYAISIDEIVDSALKNNYNLKSLEKSIEVANEQIKVSKNWKNPTLTIGANDIHFDEPKNRELEPMQAQYIGFSQIIPLGSKLEIQENIAKQDKEIAKLNLEDRKLQLKASINEYIYTILVLEKKYELLNSVQKNIKNLEKLSMALYENGKLNQNIVINTQIAYANSELEKENLNNMIKNLYVKLEEITYSKIDKIEASLHMVNTFLNTNIDTHPKILSSLEESNKLSNLSKLELAKKNSDIKVNLAYFQRDDKYKDYANISVNIPLSMYGTENLKSIKAKLKSQELNDKVQDLKNSFKSKLSLLQNDMDTSFRKYELIKKTILPLKNNIQKNIEIYNSLGQIKPQETIKNLNQIISYEMKSLDEMNNYFISISKSIYFTQGN